MARVGDVVRDVYVDSVCPGQDGRYGEKEMTLAEFEALQVGDVVRLRGDETDYVVVEVPRSDDWDDVKVASGHYRMKMRSRPLCNWSVVSRVLSRENVKGGAE